MAIMGCSLIGATNASPPVVMISSGSCSVADPDLRAWGQHGTRLPSVNTRSALIRLHRSRTGRDALELLSFPEGFTSGGQQ